MLKIIKSMSELNTEQLLSVYRQTRLGDLTIFLGETVSQDEADFLDYLRETFFRIRDAFYCVWEVDGNYVSVVRFEPYNDGLLLESLETRRTDRRKGYALALVLESLDFIHHAGYSTVYSHIAKANKPSFDLHRKCGFVEHSDTATLIDGTVSSRYYTMRYNFK